MVPEDNGDGMEVPPETLEDDAAKNEDGWTEARLETLEDDAEENEEGSSEVPLEAAEDDAKENESLTNLPHMTFDMHLTEEDSAVLSVKLGSDEEQPVECNIPILNKMIIGILSIIFVTGIVGLIVYIVMAGN